METELKYYVILSCDLYSSEYHIGSDVKFKDVLPEIVLNKKIGRKKLFQITEKERNPDDFILYHRKYVALLDSFDLATLLDEMYCDETCQTMGALTEYGMLDAISFTSHDEAYQLNAYVSPLPLFSETNSNYLDSLVESGGDQLKELIGRSIGNEISKVLDFLEDGILDLDLNDIDVVEDNVPNSISFIPNQLEIEFERV